MAEVTNVSPNLLGKTTLLTLRRMDQWINTVVVRSQVNGCRFTNDQPRLTSVIDWIGIITGYNNNLSTKLLANIKAQHPKIISMLKKHKFSGKGQKETDVANSRGLLAVMRFLPKKYTAKYHDQVDILVARYFGGDISLGPESEAIRAAQECLPDQNPLRQCGADVEAGVLVVISARFS